MFVLIQYILPIAGIPDLMMAIARNRAPVLSPMTGLTMTMFVLAMSTGLKRIRQAEKFRTSTFFAILLQTLRGSIYMTHWLVVMASTTARMSIRPKRLKWVKTVHQGSQHQ